MRPHVLQNNETHDRLNKYKMHNMHHDDSSNVIKLI